MGLIAFLLTFFVSYAATADLVVDEEFVFIEGYIEKSDAARLTKLPPDKVDTIILNSRGGDYEAAKDIAAWVRQHRKDTYIEDNEECWSGCTLVFQAGINRYSGADSRLGYHSVRTKFSEGLVFLNPSLTAEIIQLYELYGMNKECTKRIPVNTVYGWFSGLAFEFAQCDIVTEYTSKSKVAGTYRTVFNVKAVTRMKPGELSRPVH